MERSQRCETGHGAGGQGQSGCLEHAVSALQVHGISLFSGRVPKSSIMRPSMSGYFFCISAVGSVFAEDASGSVIARGAAAAVAQIKIGLQL